VSGPVEIGRAVGVRRVTPEDWEAYRELRLRALESDPLAFGSTLQREQGFTEERWKERLAGVPPSLPSVTWAAVDTSGRFIGMVAAARVGSAFHIFAMWVAPEVRGRGIGGRLLDAALSWIDREAPGGHVKLEVNSRQVAAVRLYRSRRFQATGTSSALEHAPGERTIEMIRPP
jgi:ribosomal protein S18 acetylase RimI-like enzyme